MNEQSEDFSRNHPTPNSFPGLGCLIGLVLVMGIGWALLESMRSSRARQECQTNLKRIGQALRLYHEHHGSYPPAYFGDDNGKRIHSWRVMILPELGHRDLYERYRFNESWDSSHNQSLVTEMPDTFSCSADRAKSRGMTNYFAVVGPQTIWPEQHSAQQRLVIDGLDSSIQVVESCEMSVAWLAPTDIPFDSLKEARDGLGKVCSHHESPGAHVALADGSVRFLSETIDRTTWHRLFTIAGNAPLPGVDWNLPIEFGTPDLTSAVPAESRAATDIVPVLGQPLAPNRNAIYCGTMQIAWDQLRDKLGVQKLAMKPPTSIADDLDKDRFPTLALNPKSFLTIVGTSDDRVVERIAEEMSKRFPSSTIAPPTPPRPGELLSFCYLAKRIPFVMKFDRLKEPLAFTTAERSDPVESFGIQNITFEKGAVDFLRSQVELLECRSDNEFIVRLLTQSDSIYLAKLPTIATLRDGMERVAAAAHEQNAASRPAAITLQEPFAVPILGLFVDKSFDELTGKQVSPSGVLAAVRQVIKFQLDESGAAIESQAESVYLNGESTRPVGQRSFKFDRPFLIALQERHADRPYFVAWIANAELMTTRR